MPVRTKKSNPLERATDKHPVRFNGEISFGTILSLVAMIMTLYSFYNSSNQKIADSNAEINKSLNRVDTRLAVVETKVDAMWNSFRVITGQTGD